jgi:Mrp family chromosome partitioning ATPase
MVDANLRAPSLHKHLDVMNHNGLTDLLSDSTTNIKAVATKLFGRDLWLLSSGSGEDGECFVQSDRMRDRIAELRSSFDCVMIDAPPVTACNDALTLGQLADGVVLVLRAGATRRESARRLKGELAAFGVTLLGAILNDYSSPIPEVVENWI